MLGIRDGRHAEPSGDWPPSRPPIYGATSPMQPGADRFVTGCTRRETLQCRRCSRRRETPIGMKGYSRAMEPIGGPLEGGHPRPQLTRTTWTDLSGAWDFAFDDASRGLDAGWQDRADVYPDTIMVPFPPESPASGIGQTGYHPVVWYRRMFEPAPLGADERLLLHFGAVDYRAQVWVNGQLVATHEGGHSPFSRRHYRRADAGRRAGDRGPGRRPARRT